MAKYQITYKYISIRTCIIEADTKEEVQEKFDNGDTTEDCEDDCESAVIVDFDDDVRLIK